MRGIAQVSGQLGFQHPLDQAFGQLLQPPMLSKDVVWVRIGFAQGISQGFLVSVATGHLVLLVLVLIADNPLHTSLYTLTKRGRASLRQRTAVEHALSQHIAHQGRRARSKGLRKNPFAGRLHAAVSNLQVAAHYVEERQLAS
jgi:hypothetical protein